ncbi:MAG: hypothetical protein IKT78_00390 [Ruminiclostridium sp.]|nr:hypothetical protein [Ruminiclostridium sp.]
MEKIYTIPVNEAFDACAEDHTKGCPFCEMYRRVQENELELILGASMMEPDVRIKTNEMGFCDKHFSMMLKRKNRLGLALMLESHLAHVTKEASGFNAMKKISKINDSCYICSRIEYHIDRMFETAAWLYDTDRAFEDKIRNQSYFCMHHYHKFLNAGKDELNKRKYADFERLVEKVNMSYLESLNEDVSWFCKKFDYRYDKEPWGNAKDSPERAIKFLTGSLTETE